METFKTQTWVLPELTGISAKNIEEHLKLYAGYVKSANHILSQIQEFRKESEKYTYELAELQRRFAFEFDGMRNHEYYFASLAGSAKEITAGGDLHMHITKDFGSFDEFINIFKSVALTRGVGWAILYYDKKTDKLLTQWVEEQHLGHLAGLPPVLALDMWEHAYVYDYPTSEKKKYVEAFFTNLNWAEIEKNFAEAK